MMIEMERRELHGLVTNQVIPLAHISGAPKESESRTCRVSTDANPLTVAASFGPSHPDDAAKVAMMQQQFSFNCLLFSFKFFSSRALASTQAVGGACRTFARRSDSPGPAGCAGCTQMPRPDCGPGATMKSPALLPPRRSLPLRWRCHVVESLMRVRRVSQLDASINATILRG
jgi:hypothetical protein